MIVSKIELTSLLKQAFEGCGFDTGACEAAAEMVVTSELYGFESLLKLQARLDMPGGLSALSPTLLSNIKGDSKGEISFDAAHGNLLQVGDLLSNIVFANAAESGFCVGRISNCGGSIWIIKKLLDAQHYGLHAIAYWLDEQGKGLLHIARCSLADIEQIKQDAEQAETNEGSGSLLRYPEVSSVLLTESEHAALLEAAPNAGVTSAVAAQPERLASYLQQNLAAISSPPLIVQSASESRQHYLRLLTNGIDISDELWEALIQLGNNVLVESTEQSRMGAGA